MDQMALFVTAGLASVVALYAGVRVGLRHGARDGEALGAAKMLRVVATAGERR